jgi:uncharacterized protein
MLGCSATLLGAGCSATEANSAPGEQRAALTAEPLAVHEVQGASHLSPYQDQVVRVGPAIVTATSASGFFMQSAEPDADDATSEGIFVYTRTTPTVAVGARVVVRGKVTEFRPGCGASCTAQQSAYDNLTTTELTEPTIELLDSDQPLPAAVVLGNGCGERSVPLQVISDDAPGDIELSGDFDPRAEGSDFYESLEGMRVQLDSPQVIDPTRAYSGSPPALEIGVLAHPQAGLRSARGGILLTRDDANPERLFLSNALVPSFPSVNIGASFDGAVVGVLDYSFANYKLLVTQPLPAANPGALARETTELVARTSEQLSIANMNVENLDALDAAAKFTELAQIVVHNLGAPDLIALEEVQDNDGANDDGVVAANETLQRFIAAIAAEGGPDYAYRQIDPQNNADGGEPGGNIRLAFLFRSDRGLAFVDRGSARANTANRVETNAGVVQLAYSPGRIAPSDSAFASSRKPLAAQLSFGGRTLFVIANHFNSKGGDDPLFGRTQPPVLGSEAQRIAQASRVAELVGAIREADPTAYVIALGDFNDFSFSEPLQVLQGAGLVDLIDSLPENERYTYVYQGNSQDLDHILVSESLAVFARYDVVHVNAEFTVQASDHDPGVVLLDFAVP